MSVRSKLKELYYNEVLPSSYTGLKSLIKIARKDDLHSKGVETWLRQQPTYGIHFPYRDKFPRNQIVSKYVNHMWHMDLIEVKSYKSNDNIKYLLTVIDNLSKKAYVQPLLNKQGETVKKAILRILNNSRSKPLILVSDMGTEFTNQSLKRYLRWRKIKHLVQRDRSKASVIERFNRTLKNKLFRYMTANNTERFIDVLQNIVGSYNNSVHSRTKFTPNQVNVENERQVFQNLYRLRKIQEKNSFQVGDYVRVVLVRGKFDKGYEKNYSSEIFRVYKVYKTSPYFRYRIKDRKGNIIRGSYYSKELFKVK